MVSIQKGQIDSSVIVGVVVVLAIVSAVGFSVYYFGFVRPARKELQDSKAVAKQSISGTLGEVDVSEAEKYLAKVEAADSVEEVASLRVEASVVYEREDKRAELLDLAKKVTHGSFHTLDNLYDSLKSEINSKETLSELNALESSIKSQSTSAWEDLHLETISNIPDSEEIVFRRNTSPYWEDGLTENEAVSKVEGETWSKLREMDFEESGSYAVPIVNTFRKAPTVDSDSTVAIGVYDYSKENLRLISGNAEIITVIYPKDTLSSVSWSESEDGTSHSFSTDVWEEVKASKAGAGAASNLDEWAASVVEEARQNNIGDFDLEAIYVVKVPARGDAQLITQYEQYMTDSYDVVVLPKTETG